MSILKSAIKKASQKINISASLLSIYSNKSGYLNGKFPFQIDMNKKNKSKI